MKTRGFTLIEIMVVVAIIGIISAIAYPSYIEHIVKSRRAVAAACLTELAQFMERSNTTTQSYSGIALPGTQCRTDLNGLYTIAFANGEPTASTYVIQATPQGQQATRDGRCGTLTLNHVGVKTRSGTATSVRDCW